MSDHQHSPECREIFAFLSQYLDMELPVDACRAMQAHLNDCPPCIEFAQSLRKTIELCRQYSRDTIPSPLSAEARRELETSYRKMLESRK